MLAGYSPVGNGTRAPTCCSAMAAMAAGRAKVGLVQDTEMVIRGGYLRGPVVATGLRLVDGRTYMYLAKSSLLLCNFFAVQPARKKPLAKSLMFERIAQARNDKYKALVKGTGTQPCAAPAATGQDVATDPCDLLDMDLDPLGDLGIDAGPPPQGGEPKGKRSKTAPRIRKKVRNAVSTSAEISVALAGRPDWKVWVLMEVASKAPAIEATVDNMQLLFDVIDNEIQFGGIRRPRYGSDTAGERPKPRGPRGKREYAIGRRWVTKIPLGEESPTKKFKTLKRRRSGEEDGEKKAATKMPRPGNELRLQRGPRQASSVDCLGG